MERVISVSRDPLGRLVLTLSTRELCGVVPMRCFPLSAPRERISFCDERGRELFCLPHLDELAAVDRELVERELEWREFMPTILRVLSISAGAEPTHWHVVTDRGEARFTLTTEDHVRLLSHSTAIITDANGVRYRVLDKRQLDKRSRKLLVPYF